MLGPVIIAAVIVIAIPVGLMMFGGVMSALFSWLLVGNAEAEHEDSPYLELNR